MTLIIYIDCLDGIILASDRKESDISDVGQETQKYYMPTNRDFVLALAGESTRIDMIVSELHKEQTITATTVLDKIHQTIDKTQIDNVESIVSGLLLTRDGNNFKFNNVWCSGHDKSITESRPAFKHYGDGSYLIDYFIREFDLQNKSWKEVYPYMVAIIDAVSKRVESVGSVNDYGINMLVFTEGRLLKEEVIRHTNGIGKIECTCDITNWPDLQSTTSKIIPKTQEKEQETIHNTFPIKNDGRNFNLEYQISRGKIASIELIAETKTLLVFLEAARDGEMTISVPRILIDAMVGDHNDDLLVLCDGEHAQIHETITEGNRIITIPFQGDCKEIEIIGNKLFGDRINPSKSWRHKVEDMDKAARQKNLAIAIQTDKNSYAYGSVMIVTITNPYFVPSEQMTLSITDKMENVIHECLIPVSETAGGSYQKDVRIKGRTWARQKGTFKISINYLDKSAHTLVTLKPFKISVELEKKSYSWTSTVRFKVTVLDLPVDLKKITLGDVPGYSMEISTSRGVLSGYTMVETEAGSGIFAGEVRLTGFPMYDVHGYNLGDYVNGETGGDGPTDGKIGCLSKDTLIVTLYTPTGRISSSAAIKWHHGKIHWLKATHHLSETGNLQVVDPDMILKPNGSNEVEVRVWSDSDPAGIMLNLQETGHEMGIFDGAVHFTTDESSSPNLKVSKGDRIIAEYVDRTLPEAYEVGDELPITCKSSIRKTLPTTRIRAEHVRLCDVLGHTVEVVVPNQEINIMTDITNSQDAEQAFAYIVQITEPDGIRTQPIWTNGLLASRQSKTSTVIWSPVKPGRYIVAIHVWESLNNPIPLTEPLKMPVSVKSANRSHQSHQEYITSIADAETHRSPSVPIISIPLGTAVPGCEKNCNCYVPSCITVRVNKTVMWINDDMVAHNVTCGTIVKGSNGCFNSALISPGATFTHKFVRKGTYQYFCVVHPWQTGMIIVE